MEREPPSATPSAQASSRPKPLDWPQFAGKSEPVAHAIELYVRRRRRRRVTAVIGATTLVLAAGLLWRGTWRTGGAKNTPGIALPETSATTVVSLPARQTLPDGSLVELKSGAEITVDFSAASSGPRRVRLVRGEAHFTVVKNPERPFVVAAGEVEVRAVGTAFSVEWGGSDVEVLVTAGRVAVDKSAPKPAVSIPTGEIPPAAAPLAFVDAGNRAVVVGDRAASTAQVQAVTPTELSERLAWRVPRLEFSATPLAEVVAQFNRHTLSSADGPVTRLVLADAELGHLPLSGLLRVDNVAVLLEIMRSSYGIEAERRADGTVWLRRAR